MPGGGAALLHLSEFLPEFRETLSDGACNSCSETCSFQSGPYQSNASRFSAPLGGNAQGLPKQCPCMAPLRPSCSPFGVLTGVVQCLRVNCAWSLQARKSWGVILWQRRCGRQSGSLPAMQEWRAMSSLRSSLGRTSRSATMRCVIPPAHKAHALAWPSPQGQRIFAAVEGSCHADWNAESVCGFRFIVRDLYHPLSGVMHTWVFQAGGRGI